MKNGDLWKQYDDYTRGLTDNSRLLALSAAALSWSFKTSSFQFPQTVFWALILTVIFFVLDALQYFLGALLIKIWTERQEKKMFEEKKTIDGVYQKPTWLDKQPFILWISKIFFLLASYVCIGIFLFKSQSI